MANRMTAEYKTEIVQQMIVLDVGTDRRYTSIKEKYRMGIIDRLTAFNELFTIVKPFINIHGYVSVTNFDACVKAYLELK